MQTQTILLPRRHPAQQQMIREARRFSVACCGRRFGKSTLGEDRLIHPALAGMPVAWFAPTYRMLTEIWRDVRRVTTPITASVDKQQHRIELLTGGVIEMWSLDTPNTARGRKYRRVIVDEAAMVTDLEDAWQAVIRPTLADYRGDAWILSTPKGRNYFASMFSWGQDPSNEEWASWQMPTAANPYIDAAEIEAMRLSMPERTFQQEVLALVLEDGAGVFRRVSEAATADPNPVLLPHTYVAGLDWAKSYDFTVMVVKDVDTGAYVAIDRFNQVDWAVQRDRVKAMVAKWGITAVLAERNSIGDPNIEALQREGVPVQGFTTTNSTKNHVIEQLALNIETKRTTFPNWPVLVSELQAFEMERLPSGLMRYGAPAGMHDDCVIAAALADEAATSSEGESIVFDRNGRRVA